MPASSLSSSLPAWPTNGIPCLSSWKPGASPTNIRSAFGSPEPKTTCVRPPASGHFVQPETTSAKARSSSARVSSVTAATGSAATAAATTTESAGLPGGADHGERRELAGDLRCAAVRADDLLVSPNELLEVRLALHAHVLVHRHRPGSLGASPDGRQILLVRGPDRAAAEAARERVFRDPERAGDRPRPEDLHGPLEGRRRPEVREQHLPGDEHTRRDRVP